MTTLLTDQQMQQFIMDGYVVTKPDLPADFHRHVYEQTDYVWENEFNPGNNLPARIPDTFKPWYDPAVVGALTSIVGPNYYMHPHRHCHYNPPGSPGQNLHKDGFSRRGHRTRWLLAFYYPQETTLEMGPTVVVPGSQYYNTLPSDGTERELALTVEAGTVVITNYDIWHRGSANTSESKRYMNKFLFARIEEPTAPSWDSAQTEWEPGADTATPALWRHLWNWHRGQENGATHNGSADRTASVEELVAAVVGDSEVESFNAAYTLGEIGESGVPALIEALEDGLGEVSLPADGPLPARLSSYGRLASDSETEAKRRNVTYALSAVGAPAVPELIEAVSHADWWVRAAAVNTLGEMGLAASDAVPSLIAALRHDSLIVQQQAAQALGTASQTGPAAVPALSEALQHDDAEVRRNATLALLRIGKHADEAVPALQRVLDDEDRYVRGKAVEVLYRLDTPAARSILVDYLMSTRWCPLTTKQSRY
ncbi:MAG: phytanoyl-CoA dioxygenase [Dehalococcoidia bacterium]|nr:phytanoyl-CoA dioxygenase [Dehalococcoidia bacterium]